MIVHIVFFKFKELNKQDNITKVKQMLETLPAKIPQLQKLEVGIDFNGSQRACDISLYTEFETKKDLKTYATHPDHLEVVAFIKEVVEYTKVVDYERSS